MNESKMMKKEGRGMAKADLQKHASMPASKAHAGLKKGGSVMASKMGKVATAKPKMGSASKRADGVAVKGKTKGKEIAMKGGGMYGKGCK